MKKLISNKNKLTSLMITIVGILFAIISIIYMIQSYSYYSDEWGTDISFDEDSIVMLLISVVLIVYGLYSNYAYNKNISTINAYHLSFGTISLLLSFYPIGQFIKGLAKEKPFKEVQDYLYFGIVGLVLLTYIIISYINTRKKA